MDNQIGLVKVGVDMAWVRNEMRVAFSVWWLFRKKLGGGSRTGL
jgi:hypothetical protein